LLWTAAAVGSYSLAALSTLSGEEIGWGILIAPFAFVYVVAVAGLPSIFSFIALMLRHGAISTGLVVMAFLIQVITWPSAPKCPSYVDTCPDPFATHRTVVIVCWMVFGIALAILAKKSVAADPYMIALRQRNEDRKIKGDDA